MRRTASQLRAEKIAALQAEQAEYEKRVQDASKVASQARCAVVEDLYELFGIGAEQRVRHGRSGAFAVSADRDESKRTANLLDAVSQLLERDAARPTTQSVDGAIADVDAARSLGERQHEAA